MGLLLALAVPASAGWVVDPSLRFRRFDTTHFRIYFHQGEAVLAARLARIAEETWQAMDRQFGWRPPGLTHVVLADQADAANGWATPVPYNTIMLTAAWPSGAEFIGQTDEWLRLVFSHEFTHIVHLDRSRGWARAVRGVFGRVPVAFPNLFLPGWQIEGIATYFESALTGGGRRFAGDFRAVEREPARHGQAMPLDRANGGLIAWPAGHAVYAYGLGFHEYLAGQSSVASLVELAEQTAGRIPYTGSRVFPRVFGRPLGELWTAYQSALQRESDTPATVAGRRLTDEAYDVAGARFLPPACASCGEEIAYSVRNPHEFPALKVISTAGGQARTLATRYLGGAIAVGPQRLIVDQREYHRNVSLTSDLYAVDRITGRVRTLTSGARLQDPDVAHDGRRLVATQQHRGARHLVVMPLGEDGSVGPIETMLDEPDTQYVSPRWSPDGRFIAAERHRTGEGAHVVIVDVLTRAVRVVATGATRAVTPAWRPDGRAVVVAEDVADGPFNLVEVAFDPLDDTVAMTRRRLTETTGGALGPDVSADGLTLLYVGYTATGFDVFTLPYPEAEAGATASPPSQPALPMASSASTGTPGEAPDDRVGLPYRPWTTLAPRSWTPVMTSDADQTRVGFSTGGTDVLGYHAYGGWVQWRLAAPTDGPGVWRTPDWSVGYTYQRWMPLLYGSGSSTTSFLRGASALDGEIGILREQTVEAGVQLPLRQVLRSQRWLVSTTRSANRLVHGAREERVDRTTVRTAWAFRTARSYGYSISAEDGVSAAVTAEFGGRSLGRLDEATTVTADLRAYVPGAAPHHVFAVRAGGGVSTGPRDVGRTFRLGGAGANPEPLDFGRGAFSLLRGFGPDSFGGRRVAVVNADYRWPVALIERGHGTWPAFLRQVHASVFADVGHAWSAGFAAGDVKLSVGGELSADVVMGFALPFTFSAGVARGHDGAGRVPDRTTAYVRVGRAF